MPVTDAETKTQRLLALQMLFWAAQGAVCPPGYQSIAIPQASEQLISVTVDLTFHLTPA